MARAPTDVLRESEVAGIGAAVDHGVADLDAGGPAVEQDAAGLEFEDRQQLRGVVVVGLVGVHGRGELAFDVLGDGLHLGGVLAAHDEAGGAEDLGLQALGLAEGWRRRWRTGRRGRRFRCRWLRRGR